MTNTTSPIIVDTFIETRGDRPQRVLHPVADPDNWAILRRKYDQRRRNGQGTTELPTDHALSVSVFFSAGSDRFMVMANREQLVGHNHIMFSRAWICIHDVWLLMDTTDLRVRSHKNIPAEHLQTDKFIIRGDIYDRTPDDILKDVSRKLDVPEYLLKYGASYPEFHVTVSVPRAPTERYNRLRREYDHAIRHHRAHHPAGPA